MFSLSLFSLSCSCQQNKIGICFNSLNFMFSSEEDFSGLGRKIEHTQYEI